ncbi:hypothetical protein [Melioribacter sp. OK-6-Me]|uniref:hypothetical protein n=1 Tax=unclassified Melioribacter TaxID=2627329 RepID=UPI003EDB5D6C
MKPIWYFVGLILLIMGGIIFLNGIYQALHPESVKTVLKETHPSLWWGAVMIIFGAVMFFKTKNQSV